MLSDGSKVVKLANKKSAKQLNSALRDVDQPDAYTCTFSLAVELSASIRSHVWNVIEENMRELYVDSSMGWEPREKQAELFDPLARYILLCPADNPLEIAGYSAFRFEYEDQENLLYCYELQISRSHQRKGLGNFLISLLEAVGKKMKMDKIMLTVLEENKGALDFYTKAGFQLDPCSPTHSNSNEEEGDNGNVDYQILSKLLV